MKATKPTEEEIQHCKEFLRENYIPEGSVVSVYCIGSTGTNSNLVVLLPFKFDDGLIEVQDRTGSVAIALGKFAKYIKAQHHIRVSGGMRAASDTLVEDLSMALYGRRDALRCRVV